MTMSGSKQTPEAQRVTLRAQGLAPALTCSLLGQQVPLGITPLPYDHLLGVVPTAGLDVLPASAAWLWGRGV